MQKKIYLQIKQFCSDTDSNLTISYNRYNTILGKILVASTKDGIVFIGFDNEYLIMEKLKEIFPFNSFVERYSDFHQPFLDILENSTEAKHHICLHLKYTDFQIKVYNSLLKISHSRLLSYKDIAKDMNTTAFRAIGTALGKNLCAIIIPCHRVLSCSGKLGGYRYGTEIKAKLIDYELQCGFWDITIL